MTVLPFATQIKNDCATIKRDCALEVEVTLCVRGVVMRLRDEFSTLYQDEDFRALYPSKGQPALAPWRLALITVFQFLEHLSDRQAADAVRARIDWNYVVRPESR